MYEAHNITDMTDIPPLFGTFASAVGWSTDLTDVNAPKFWHPTAPSPLHFVLTPPSNQALRVALDSAFWTEDSNSEIGGAELPYAESFSPLRGASPGAYLDPTVVYFIGSLLPEPYLHVVVQYGTNLFRHMYVGHMEKIGDYTGGEVWCGTEGPAQSNQADIDYRNADHMKYLFSYNTRRKIAGQNGAIHVEHADEPHRLRTFDGGSFSNTPITVMDGTEVLGGFNDDINDGYVARGRSPFAGQTVLGPINLYYSKPVIGDTSFIPIGRPAGIRHVNVQDIEPGAEVVVGGELWRVFPSHARSSSKLMPKFPPKGDFTTDPRESETSYWFGYAINVGEEDSNS